MDIWTLTNELLRCPKCLSGLFPIRLDKDDLIFWSCANNKECDFPMEFPQQLFFVKRTQEQKNAGVLPLPNAEEFPSELRRLYPRVFKASDRRNELSHGGVVCNKSPHDKALVEKDQALSTASSKTGGISNGFSDANFVSGPHESFIARSLKRTKKNFDREQDRKLFKIALGPEITPRARGERSLQHSNEPAMRNNLAPEEHDHAVRETQNNQYSASVDKDVVEVTVKKITNEAENSEMAVFLSLKNRLKEKLEKIEEIVYLDESPQTVLLHDAPLNLSEEDYFSPDFLEITEVNYWNDIEEDVSQVDIADASFFE